MREEEDASPALQVIVLGSGGGPQESNITAFLVRAVAQEWSKGSLVAVDAGVHLSAITRLIEESLPSPRPTGPYTLTEGPFAGLRLPHQSPSANAAYVTRSLVDTYLITHPHLDHISGFVINTAGLPGSRPKKLAGLPATIQAFKTHIFNNVIWPNLSDENNGAGLVTYLRLVEGGSPALGDGEGRGYTEVCDGLLVKIWGVSHGHCIEKHSHRGSASSSSTRFGSYDASTFGPPPPGSVPTRRESLLPPRKDAFATSSGTSGGSYAFSKSQTLPTTWSSSSQLGGGAGGEQDRFCVYDSSAYFIQDHEHKKEVLIFGDVEPDSISLSPRNALIWQEAAPKIASGTLAAIFIECSYDDSQGNDRLFGHLKPCFIMEEMRALAAEVDESRKAIKSLDQQQQQQQPKKRKRQQSVAHDPPRKSTTNSSKRDSSGSQGPAPINNGDTSNPAPEDPVSPKTVSKAAAAVSAAEPGASHLSTPTRELTLKEMELSDSAIEIAARRGPLDGLKVVIIHVKENLGDGPQTGDTILEQLLEYEKEAQLGCEFVMSKPGQSFYF